MEQEQQTRRRINFVHLGHMSLLLWVDVSFVRVVVNALAMDQTVVILPRLTQMFLVE